MKGCPIFNIKDRYHFWEKGLEKIFQGNGSEKQADIAILISDKIDFKPILIRRNREDNMDLLKENSMKMILQF